MKVPRWKFIGQFTFAVVVLVQVTWFICPHQGGPMLGDKYRNQERAQAFRAYTDSPSLVTKTAFEQEQKLLSRHEENQFLSLLIINVSADVVFVAAFWRVQYLATRRITPPGCR
jgi:hypothetical protein